MPLSTLQSFQSHEARAEKITCIVWMLVIAFTYALFISLVSGDSISEQLNRNITLLTLIMIPAFGGLAWIIHLGFYSTSSKFINVFLQVTLVSAAIVFDSIAQGPAYALSSMPPLAYALVPMITAFRLQPLLGLFAGLVSALEFVLLYLFLLKPDPALVAQIPSLGLDVTLMKAIVLFSLGVASAFAARSLKNYFIEFGKAQETRYRLAKSFGRFVSPEIVSKIEQSADGNIPPNEQNAAIVFGDIRNFTSYASRHSSAEVNTLLNQFFEKVCGIVEEEGGMVNKFLGDGYLALFGVYSKDEEPCESAARAVLRIQSEVADILTPRGLSTGAAANYGSVITGEIGSQGRCEFTAIGDTVNMASRVEGMNAQLDTHFLVTEDFLAQLNPAHFRITDRGSHALKGVEEKVALFELGSG